MRTLALSAALTTVALVCCSGAAFAPPIAEVWRTPHSELYDIIDIADLDANGSLELLTAESESFPGPFIGVRSVTTGALLAQTANRYQYLDLFHTDLDGDGPHEILFRDNMNGRETCIPYPAPSGPLVPRWAIRPFGGAAAFSMNLADLDGNGHQYVVFQAQSQSAELEIYTNQGTLFATYNPSMSMEYVFESLLIQDFDSDGRDEIMLVFRNNSASVANKSVILIQSIVPVGVASPSPGSLRVVQLGASFPNPMSAKTQIDYTVPVKGPVTLRLLDVAGREVRTLVAGDVSAGRHLVSWDGKDGGGRAMPAGSYFYELTANGQKLGRRIVRLP